MAGEILYYIPLLLGIVFFIMGREYQDYLFGLMSGFLFFLYGVAILITPLPTIDSFTNLLIGNASWGAGLYIILRGSIERFKGGE